MLNHAKKKRLFEIIISFYPQIRFEYLTKTLQKSYKTAKNMSKFGAIVRFLSRLLSRRGAIIYA